MPTRSREAREDRPRSRGDLVRHRFANGARLLCTPVARDLPVAIQLWVGAGAAAERARERGAAHLLEHLLFKPFAAGGPPGDLARLIEGLGGDVNAFTSHDETVLYATVPAAAWGPAVDGILWAGLRPRLAAAEVAREIEVVLEEIKQYDDDPGMRAIETLLAHLHRDHPYARPVLGRAREVRGHSVRCLRAVHRRLYAGDRLTLVVVGPVDPEAVRARAEPLLAAAPTAEPRAAVVGPVPATAVRATLRRGDTCEAHLHLGWRIPGLEDPVLPALDVAAIVLGQGEASRLVCEVRRRAQVVTEIHSAIDSGREASSLMIAARTGTGDLVEALRTILSELRRLSASPLALEELARARAAIESDLVYRHETVQGQAYALGYYASQTGEPAREEEYYRALRALTPEAIRAAVARWLAVDAVALSVIVPGAEVDAAGARDLRRALLAATRPPKRRRRPTATTGLTAVDLECGLRLRLLRDPSVPVASAWLAWLGGLRREPAAHAGLASITADLLSRGNARDDGERLSRAIEGMAADLGGFAGSNLLGLHGEALARHFPTVLDHLLESALTPRFADDELTEARRVALEELAAQDDELGQRTILALRDLLYGDHPFARPLRGSPRGLRSLDPDLLRQRWRRDYPIGQAVLAIAGDIDVDATIDAIAARLAGVAGVTGARRGRPWRPGRVTGAPENRRPRSRRLYRDREQAHLALGFPGLCLGDPRLPALEVLLAALGGQSGRLFLALREEEGLVYHVDAMSTEGLDAGHLVIYAATSQDKLGRALAAIDRHLAAIVDRPLAAAELARAKHWLIGQHAIGLQRRSRVANAIAFDVACGRPADHFLGYRQRIAGVTADQLLDLARALFDRRRRARVLMTRRGVDLRG